MACGVLWNPHGPDQLLLSQQAVWWCEARRVGLTRQMFDIHAGTFPVWIWVRGESFGTSEARMLVFTTDRLLSLNSIVVLQMDADTEQVEETTEVMEATETPSHEEPSADSKIRWVTWPKLLLSLVVLITRGVRWYRNCYFNDVQFNIIEYFAKHPYLSTAVLRSRYQHNII